MSTAKHRQMLVLAICALLVIHPATAAQEARTTRSGNRSETNPSPTRPNILMIIVDDLRPELGVYYDGKNKNSFSRIRTPSMNSLASRSLLLKKAYVQQAICAPSRLSFLTSRRPDTTGVYTIEDTYWRRLAGDFVTIPQFFKNNGYRSVGVGKVFHHGPGSNQDDPPSWSEEYNSVPKESKLRYSDRSRSWRAVSPSEREKHPLPDDHVADMAVDLLQELGPEAVSGGSPFFMAVGFYKPHLPFVFPQQYLDLYPLENVRLPRNNRTPRNMPEIAWNNWEIRKYPDVARLNIPDEIAGALPANVSRDLCRAYYCCVSYVDDLVGKVLWELERQGLENNTIVVLLGDHGWHLGEGNLWGKHTNFELSTRAPLIVRVPGLTDRGLVHDRPVEFVDIFPTLVEAAGFQPLPVCPENSAAVPLCTEGSSLMDLIQAGKDAKSSARAKSAQGVADRDNTTPRRKEVAFSQYPRRGFSVMGYSIRTNRFRYTEWIRKYRQNPEGSPNSSRLRIVHAVELYDHQVDPDEAFNVADAPLYARDQAHLSRALQAGWRGALAPNNISRASVLRQRVRRITVRPPRSRTHRQMQ